MTRGDLDGNKRKDAVNSNVFWHFIIRQRHLRCGYKRDICLVRYKIQNSIPLSDIVFFLIDFILVEPSQHAWDMLKCSE